MYTRLISREILFGLLHSYTSLLHYNFTDQPFCCDLHRVVLSDAVFFVVSL